MQTDLAMPALARVDEAADLVIALPGALLLGRIVDLAR